MNKKVGIKIGKLLAKKKFFEALNLLYENNIDVHSNKKLKEKIARACFTKEMKK